jgi:hypothetical protein
VAGAVGAKSAVCAAPDAANPVPADGHRAVGGGRELEACGGGAGTVGAEKAGPDSVGAVVGHGEGACIRACLLLRKGEGGEEEEEVGGYHGWFYYWLLDMLLFVAVSAIPDCPLNIDRNTVY